MTRPLYKPTVATRRAVAISAGAGMSHEEMAIALKISRNTLEKHFQSELSEGAYQKRMEVVSAMHKAAKAGNVAAQKAYMALTPRLSAPPASPPAPEEKPLGKKEQADADAKTAALGSDWEMLLPSASMRQ